MNHESFAVSSGGTPRWRATRSRFAAGWAWRAIAGSAVWSTCCCERRWPDGGWNCRPDLDSRHSSFHESLRHLGTRRVPPRDERRRRARAARRTGELLQASTFRSSRTGKVIDPVVAEHPLASLLALRLLPRLARDQDARPTRRPGVRGPGALRKKRRPDGTWRAGGGATGGAQRGNRRRGRDVGDPHDPDAHRPALLE